MTLAGVSGLALVAPGKESLTPQRPCTNSKTQGNWPLAPDSRGWAWPSLQPCWWQRQSCPTLEQLRFPSLIPWGSGSDNVVPILQMSKLRHSRAPHPRLHHTRTHGPGGKACVSAQEPEMFLPQICFRERKQPEPAWVCFLCRLPGPLPLSAGWAGSGVSETRGGGLEKV